LDGSDSKHQPSQPTAIGQILRQLKRTTGTGRKHTPQSRGKGPESSYNGPDGLLDHPRPKTALQGVKCASGINSDGARVKGAGPTAVEPWLSALMTHWSETDLHDEEHVRSNITRLARMYRESGLSADAFQARMYRAHKLTFQHHPRNAAAYYFQVLGDLLPATKQLDSRPGPTS
jgi:hypothetical protein